MGMKKNKKILPPTGGKVTHIKVAMPHPMADEVRDIYKRDYEFVKPHSENSPVRPWEHRMITQDVHNYADDRLKAMVGKTHHGFGHEGGAQVKGNLRMSGKKGAHQIGKRSKAGSR
jgi:hypothetical protein